MYASYMLQVCSSNIGKVYQRILCVVFRAPRFKGFQQQDSHELLRHLMDGMKAEEIKVSLQLVHLQ